MNLPAKWRRCGLCEGPGHVVVERHGGHLLVRGWGLTKWWRAHYLELLQAWDEAERDDPSEEGRHYVSCPACAGRGVVSWWALLFLLLRAVLGGIGRVVATRKRNAKGHEQ